MKKITSIEQLNQELKPGDKFYEVFNSQVKTFIFCCIHPKQNNMVIAVSDSEWSNADVIQRFKFRSPNVCILIGEYDSAMIGNILIDLLKEQIKSVTETYLNRQPLTF